MCVCAYSAIGVFTCPLQLTFEPNNTAELLGLLCCVSAASIEGNAPVLRVRRAMLSGSVSTTAKWSSNCPTRRQQQRSSRNSSSRPKAWAWTRQRCSKVGTNKVVLT